MDVKNLKLIARTEDDLRVVSAHLQDAIVNVQKLPSNLPLFLRLVSNF